MEGTQPQTGTGFYAHAAVHFHFEKLHDTLYLQERLAQADVDEYLKERLTSLRQAREHLATALSQVRN